MVFREAFRSVASSFDHPQVNLLLILTRRRRSQVVRQRSAKPSSRVRFPPSPQKAANSRIAQSRGKVCRASVFALGMLVRLRELGLDGVTCRAADSREAFGDLSGGVRPRWAGVNQAHEPW